MWEQRELGCSTQRSKFTGQTVKKIVRSDVKLKINLLAGNFHWFPYISFITDDGAVCLIYQQSELLRDFLGVCLSEVCWKNKRLIETECLGHMDEDSRNRETKKIMLNFYWKTLWYLDAQLGTLKTSLTPFDQDFCTPFAIKSHN